ncbi:MAG: hypothetical protein V3R55_00935, partial [Alphaproteobacteria bacterium]
GSLRRSPDARASRFTPRLPGKPICRHQIDSIWSDSALVYPLDNAMMPLSRAPFRPLSSFDES